MAARETYVLRDGKLVPKRLAPVLPIARSRLPRPYVIGDGLGGINGLVNHADGRRYDSRSRFLQAVKDSGCEVSGNEAMSYKPVAYDKQGLHGDIRRAVAELNA